MTKMDTYISKEEVAQAIREYAESRAFNSFYKGMRKALEIANNVPAANVRPVVRRKWRQTDEDTWGGCSNCGILWTLNDGNPHDNNVYFCPNCGARMKED